MCFRCFYLWIRNPSRADLSFLERIFTSQPLLSDGHRAGLLLNRINGCTRSVRLRHTTVSACVLWVGNTLHYLVRDSYYFCATDATLGVLHSHPLPFSCLIDDAFLNVKAPLVLQNCGGRLRKLYERWHQNHWTWWLF